MAKMKLYCSPGSPYARKVRIVAMETKLDKKMEMVNVAVCAAIPTRVEHVPPDASFDFAMIRRQKISARHLFGAGKNATLKKVSAICGAMPSGSSRDD